MDCDGILGNATKPILNPMFKNGLHYESSIKPFCKKYYLSAALYS